MTPEGGRIRYGIHQPAAAEGEGRRAHEWRPRWVRRGTRDWAPAVGSELAFLSGYHAAGLAAGRRGVDGEARSVLRFRPISCNAESGGRAADPLTFSPGFDPHDLVPESGEGAAMQCQPRNNQAPAVPFRSAQMMAKEPLNSICGTRILEPSWAFLIPRRSN
jgi:hypothetical protein